MTKVLIPFSGRQDDGMEVPFAVYCLVKLTGRHVNAEARRELGRMHKQCVKCNARCCRYFCFQIAAPVCYEDFEQVRWYLAHEAVSVHVDPEGGWWILLDNRCRWLIEAPRAGRGARADRAARAARAGRAAGAAPADEPRCAHYRKRPLICRRFSPARCDFTLGPYDYDECFRSPDELESYARRMLGAEAFASARKQPHRKGRGERKKKTRIGKGV